jgi:hypothetical protein
LSLLARIKETKQSRSWRRLLNVIVGRATMSVL